MRQNYPSTITEESQKDKALEDNMVWKDNQTKKLLRTVFGPTA
jgi:hypothetical protein